MFSVVINMKKVAGIYVTDFSEFSFGYALTRCVESRMGNVAHVPSFPSQYEEGKAGGGYDVRIASPLAPIFIQFKIPRVVTRQHPNADDRNLLAYPHYRMPLHAKVPNRPDQHKLLRDLEKKGYDRVYYASPAFDDWSAIDKYHRTGTIVDYTAFIRPQSIGDIQDSDEHYVAYESGNNTGWFCSDPVKVELQPWEHMLRLMMHGGERTENMYDALIAAFSSIAGQNGIRLPTTAPTKVDPRYERAITASYLARMVFNAQLFVLVESEPS
jgi:hypothetical protein